MNLSAEIRGLDFQSQSKLKNLIHGKAGILGTEKVYLTTEASQIFAIVPLGIFDTL